MAAQHRWPSTARPPTIGLVGVLGGAAQATQDLEGLCVHRVHAVGVDLDAGIQGHRGALEVGLRAALLADQLGQVLDQVQRPRVLRRDLVLAGHLEALPQHGLQLGGAVAGRRRVGRGADILLAGCGRRRRHCARRCCCWLRGTLRALVITVSYPRGQPVGAWQRSGWGSGRQLLRQGLFHGQITVLTADAGDQGFP